MVVRLAKEEQKWEIIRKKSMLRGRKERIGEDWTWKERKIKWKLEEIARKEEREGKQVWVGYGKIRINERWWKWNEEQEVLRDEKGKERMVEGGRQEGGGGDSEINNKGGERRKERGEGKEGEWKVMFWNVAANRVC